VRAIAVEHRFEIDTSQLDPAWSEFRTDDRSFFNGHYYSDKAIGSSLLGAAVWAPVHLALQMAGLPAHGRVFKVGATCLAMSLPCALLAPLIYGFVASLANGRLALLVTSAIIFGTPVFRYSTGFYGHVLAGLLLFATFLIWFRGRLRHAVSLGEVFVSCVFLGAMLITEYPSALLAGVLAVYMLFVQREIGLLTDWQVYAVGAAGGVLAISPLLYYNLAVYGHMLTTGYQHHATARFAAAHSQGLSGIGWPDPVVMFATTFHPLMGIFWQSPVLLLAAAGWMRLRDSQYRAELLFSLAAILAYVTVMSGYYEWSGGLAYAPRHLIPILPLFAIPLAFLPQRCIGVGWALTAVAIAQHLVAVSARWDYLWRTVRASLDDVHHPTTLFISTIWSVCWPNLQHGLFLKNRGTLFLGSGFTSLLPLLLIEILLAVLLIRALDRRERGEQATR